MARNFKDLSEQEILALAISLEETDARIYADFAAWTRKRITPPLLRFFAICRPRRMAIDER